MSPPNEVQALFIYCEFGIIYRMCPYAERGSIAVSILCVHDMDISPFNIYAAEKTLELAVTRSELVVFCRWLSVVINADVFVHGSCQRPTLITPTTLSRSTGEEESLTG